MSRRNEYKQLHYFVRSQVWGENVINLTDTLINEETEAEDKKHAVLLFLAAIKEMLENGATVIKPSICRPGFILKNKYGEKVSVWLAIEEDDNY